MESQHVAERTSLCSGGQVTRTQEVIQQLQAAYAEGGKGAILTIDPDAATPGVAIWTPPTPARLHESHDHTRSAAWSWGGNLTSAALVTPQGASRLLHYLGPLLSLVVIEDGIASGGAHAGSMGAQNLVRGGWYWLARLRVPTILLPPPVWQRAICGVVRGGEGVYKQAYKAHARGLLDKAAVNEDQAAALCMLDFVTDSVVALDTLPRSEIKSIPLI